MRWPILFAFAGALAAQSITVYIPTVQGTETIWQRYILDGFQTSSDAVTGRLHLSPIPVMAQTVDMGPAVTCSVDGSTCTICADCLTSPHKARVNGVTYTFTSPAVVTISGSPTLRFYISDGSDGTPPGTWVVANSAASGVACDAHCVASNSTAQFSGLPLAIFTPGTPVQDQRAALAIH